MDQALQINEILLKITDSLSLDDLCSFSRSSIQNWAVSKKQFERKYFMKFLKINQNADGKITVLENERYIRYFMKHIQNIIVSNSRFGPNEKVFRYFSQNFSQNLREIRFEFIHIHEDKPAAIQQNLKNVEIITFESCRIDGNIYKNFLTFCPNIRHLVFRRTALSDDESSIWLTGECPKLESIQIKIRRKTDSVFWNQFFEQNPNVPRLETILLEGDHPVMRQMCRQIALRADKLKSLCLSVSADFELNAIEEELSDINEKESLQKIEMEFDGSTVSTLTQNIPRFSKLNKLKGLYFDSVHVRTGLFPSIDRLANVKTLNWEHVLTRRYNIELEMVWRIETPVNNLENIFFRSSEMLFAEEPVRFFLCKLPKLKTIVIYRYMEKAEIEILKEELKTCRIWRDSNLGPVDVFVCHRNPDELKLVPAANDSENKMKLKVFTDEQRYNFFKENPFIQHLDPDINTN